MQDKKSHGSPWLVNPQEFTGHTDVSQSKSKFSMDVPNILKISDWPTIFKQWDLFEMFRIQGGDSKKCFNRNHVWCLAKYVAGKGIH